MVKCLVLSLGSLPCSPMEVWDSERSPGNRHFVLSWLEATTSQILARNPQQIQFFWSVQAYYGNHLSDLQESNLEERDPYWTGPKNWFTICATVKTFKSLSIIEVGLVKPPFERLSFLISISFFAWLHSQKRSFFVVWRARPSKLSTQEIDQDPLVLWSGLSSLDLRWAARFSPTVPAFHCFK